MKRFSGILRTTPLHYAETLTPGGWLVILMPFWMATLFVFRVTPWELLAFLAADAVSFAIVIPMAMRRMPTLLPRAWLLLTPELDVEGLRRLAAAERAAVVQELAAFPERKCRHLLVFSLIKAILPIGVACFYWQHQTPLLVHVFLCVSVITVFSHVIYYGALYYETHELVSGTYRSLQELGGWDDAFRELRVEGSSADFARHEATMLAAAGALLFINQLAIISTAHSWTKAELLTVSATIGLSELVQVGWLWRLSRRYFLGSLDAIFARLSDVRAKPGDGPLPLHSVPLLARFEQTFNAMLDRMRDHERELARWAFKRSEEERFLALAEISALIVHDLSSPLQAVELDASTLARRHRDERDEAGFRRLLAHVARARELVGSLNTYLRSSEPPLAGVAVGEACEHVMRIVMLRFSANSTPTVFSVEPAAKAIRLRMTKADVIHTLMNLFVNAIENQLTAGVPEPTVALSMGPGGPTHAEILVRDRGTGMDRDRFEHLTNFMFEPTGAITGRALGLRLVRRVIERAGGRLDIVALPPGEPGTCFQLLLPRAPAGDPDLTESGQRLRTTTAG